MRSGALPQRGQVPVAWAALTGAVLACLPFIFIPKVPGALLPFFGVLVAHWISAVIIGRRMRALRDDAHGGQFAASLRLSRETSYAYDEGLVSFEDGWLIFTGHRCTFSVGVADIFDPGWKKGDYRFGFPAYDGELYAWLCGFPTRPFQQAAMEWEAAGRKSGSPVYPPRVPQEFVRQGLRVIPFAAAIPFVVFLLVLVLTGRSTYAAIPFWAGVVAAAVGAAYSFRTRRILDGIALGAPARNTLP